MSECNGCIHLPICSSREEKCQHYQSKADVFREIMEDVGCDVIEDCWHCPFAKEGYCLIENKISEMEE